MAGDRASWAQHHFRDLLQDPWRSLLLALSSIFSLLGFHRLENQVLVLLSQVTPCSSSVILKATGRYLHEEIFAVNPLLSPCGASGLFFPSSILQKSCFPTCLMLRWTCHAQQQKGESRDEDIQQCPHTGPCCLWWGKG